MSKSTLSVLFGCDDQEADAYDFLLRALPGEDRVRMLGYLPEGTSNFICPIKLLLIHALRNGFIADANSLDEVLANANSRVDKTVQWAHPEYPVMPAIASSKTFLNWTEPATAQQLRLTVRQMGLIGGVLVPLTVHDARRGSCRDLANLPSEIKGTANPGVARAMGHTRTSLSKGVTDSYVGPISIDLNSLKVANQSTINWLLLSVLHSRSGG